MIRVAQLIGALQVGGAERQVLHLASNLDPELFESHIIVFSEAKQGFRDSLSPALRYYCLNYRRRFFLAGLRRLYSYLRSNRIDVLQCHMYHATLPGSVLGRLAGVPVILTTEHGKNTWKTWRHHLLERLVVTPLVTHRVAVSEDIRRLRMQLDGVPAEKISVIGNAVDTGVPAADPGKTPHRLGALGRLVDAKDYPVLLRAMRYLLDNGRDLQLDIAGEGGCREELERLIADLDLADRVRLRGIRPSAEFLQGIDVFVMSSKREGVPVALLEAMAHGMPVVATGVGGIPEVLRDGMDGLLCDSGRPEQLASAISRMLDDRGLRVACAQSARERVVSLFGIENYIARWERLYQALCSQGHSLA